MAAMPERLNLLSFLDKTSSSQLVIPVYQRNYTWQAKKQVHKFLYDYSVVLNQKNKKHFIGVLMHLSILRGIGLPEISVVDGQQRLITVFLMLESLKEIAKENGDFEFAEKIESKYMLSNDNSSEQKLKLKPLVSDDDVYKKIVTESKDISVSEKKTNVYVNYLFIKKKLYELYGAFSLEDMLNAFERFDFVAIPLTQEDNAQEVFETINSAGAALSKSDLIRNYLLMNLESSTQEQLYENYWCKIEDLFYKNGKIQNFFRMFIASQTYELPSMDNLYESFVSWFSDTKNKNGKTIKEIFETLLIYAQAYYEIYASIKVSTNRFTKKLQQALSEFKESTIEPTAPFLMEVYVLWESGKVSEDEFVKIINLFNIYNMRRNLCNLRTGILTRFIPIMLKNVIESCNGDYSNIYQISGKHLVSDSANKTSFMPDDAYMKANLETMNAYSLRNYLKVAFKKIESHNNPAIVDFSNLTIEHLMPQTPTEEWIKSLGVTRDVYEYNLHRLGNLTLATKADNSAMSNNPFEYKQKVLEKTNHINMNTYILEKSDWTIADISDRTTLLINSICSLYPYVQFSNTSFKTKYAIHYVNDNTNVKGYIYDDMTVEISAGSYFSKNLGSSDLDELLEEGSEIIKETTQGYVFETNYLFENLKVVSDLVCDYYTDEWDIWKDYNGYSLNFDVKVKIVNKNGFLK